MANNHPTPSSENKEEPSIKEEKCIPQLKPSWLGHSASKTWQTRFKEDCSSAHTAKDASDDEIEILSDSTYQTNLRVPKCFFGLIIGKNWSTKATIEKETMTRIHIPKQGDDGDITILGPTAANVVEAKNTINNLVLSGRRRNCTHFISIPMNHPDIIKRVQEFQSAVVSECNGSKGFDETIFKNPLRLHLTVGVMCLLDNAERLHASKLLRDAKTKVVAPLLAGHLPLKIRLKGLSYMNIDKTSKVGDPSNIHVLYATVQEEGGKQGLIQELVDGLVNYFNKAGFMERESDKVTLHVTLMNTRYRQQIEMLKQKDSGSNNYARTPKISFDGTDVLNKFSDFDFGVIELDNIHISKKNTAGPDGYYEACAIESVLS